MGEPKPRLASSVRRALALAGVVAVVSLIAILSVGAFFENGLRSAYHGVRSGIFSGFLSLGGFLFTATAFIVIRMKEGVYDSDSYAEILQSHEAIGIETDRYAPLRSLSAYLFWCVKASVLTALAQVTFGLWPHALGIALALASVAFTFTLAIIALREIKANFDRWLEDIKAPKKASGDGLESGQK